jgi:hypothetical protein
MVAVRGPWETLPVELFHLYSASVFFFQGTGASLIKDGINDKAVSRSAYCTHLGRVSGQIRTQEALKVVGTGGKMYPSTYAGDPLYGKEVKDPQQFRKRGAHRASEYTAYVPYTPCRIDRLLKTLVSAVRDNDFAAFLLNRGMHKPRNIIQANAPDFLHLGQAGPSVLGVLSASQCE